MSVQPNITLNANFMSPFTNFQNGVLGQVAITNDGASGGNYRYICDTTSSNGVSMFIPYSNEFLTISFVSPDSLAIIGTTTPLISNYMLTLFFDFIEDSPLLMDKPENNLPR